MSDANLIACGEDHELAYVLRKFGKSGNKENVDFMREHCKAFKADDAYKPHNRDSYYKYLEDKNILEGLS